MSFTSNIVEANGITQHYYRSGAGSESNKPPLIMLHGFTDDGSCWFPVTDALTTHYDVILPDARGHGKSARVADIGFGNEALAEDVSGLIRGLGLNRPAVVGHSMGAFTALILTASHPDQVGCLVLEDPPLAQWQPSTPEIEAERSKGMRQWAENTRQIQGVSIETLIEGHRKNSPRWNAAELQTWAESKHRIDLDVFEARSPRIPWQNLLQQVACPVLLVYGDTGSLVDETIAQEAAGLWKQGQAVQISHAGHSIRRDNAADYLEAVQKFLRAHYKV